jgi:hypothetical protein
MTVVLLSLPPLGTDGITVPALCGTNSSGRFCTGYL